MQQPQSLHTLAILVPMQSHVVLARR